MNNLQWNLRTAVGVNPGYVVKYPISMAFNQVASSRYPAVACRKLIQSLAVWIASVDKLAWRLGCGWKLMCPKPSAACWPVVMILVPCLMMTCVSLNLAVYPALQRVPMEMREPDVRSGNICAC